MSDVRVVKGEVCVLCEKAKNLPAQFSVGHCIRWCVCFFAFVGMSAVSFLSVDLMTKKENIVVLATLGTIIAVNVLLIAWFGIIPIIMRNCIGRKEYRFPDMHEHEHVHAVAPWDEQGHFTADSSSMKYFGESVWPLRRPILELQVGGFGKSKIHHTPRGFKWEIVNVLHNPTNEHMPLVHLCIGVVEQIVPACEAAKIVRHFSCLSEMVRQGAGYDAKVTEVVRLGRQVEELSQQYAVLGVFVAWLHESAKKRKAQGGFPDSQHGQFLRLAIEFLYQENPKSSFPFPHTFDGEHPPVLEGVTKDTSVQFHACALIERVLEDAKGAPNPVQEAQAA
ncbi:MAG: hypothetical protein ABIH21_01950 [Patescibacteria group bacterium]